MQNISAIGFDLFNTLITIEPEALEDALGRLWQSLSSSGLHLQRDGFLQAHREAALEHILSARQTGLETHNRFWVSQALKSLGHPVEPGDPRIAQAVEDYFSAFAEHARLIPGTLDILASLGRRYTLGLLSNFTHPPAARAILDHTGLSSHFQALIISGDLGLRKPHPGSFSALTRAMGVAPEQMLYIGDNPEADVDGASQAGIRPVWMTYVRDNNLAFAPGVSPEQKESPLVQSLRISDWSGLEKLVDSGLKH